MSESQNQSVRIRRSQIIPTGIPSEFRNFNEVSFLIPSDSDGSHSDSDRSRRLEHLLFLLILEYRTSIGFNSDGFQSGSDGFRLDSDGFRSDSDGIPTHSDGIPTDFDGF